MNVNRLGKLLVFVNLICCVLAMTWSAGVFLQFIDWGWKEPRLDLDKRVPSELDKRSAALTEAMKATDLVYPTPLKAVQDSLAAAEKRFAENHLFYVNELTRLRIDPMQILIKGVKLPSDPTLDTPTIGQPVLDENMPDVDKSYEEYRKLFFKVQQDTKAEAAKIEKEIEKQKKITEWLNDRKKEDKGNKWVEKGLYTLLKEETDLQAQIKFEREYIQPRWVRSLEEVQLYKERRVGLEKTLDNVKKFRQAQGQR